MLEMRLKVKKYLSEGIFKFFKPVHGTDVELKMIEYNKKMLEVHDDEKLKRTRKKNSTSIETQLFSF